MAQDIGSNVTGQNSYGAHALVKALAITLGLNLLCTVIAWSLKAWVGAGWVAPFMFLGMLLTFALFAISLIALSVRGARGLGLFSLLLTPIFGLSYMLSTWSGGGWGRPLRIHGRQVHPELREGSDWSRGARPSTAGLDPNTCRALEALWLHDAQKEHASVPAFARISWMLAAVGAPADLMEWAHRAAMEEIEHARQCFALAAGYGARQHSVEPMPDLLLGGLDLSSNPLITLAIESLSDGCQLEDFNADVAAACHDACQEPATRAVLDRIAREERSHAEFSWALLAWLVERSPTTVRPAVEKAAFDLVRCPRPTAVSAANRALFAKADTELLLRHGRIPDTRWAELWEQRLVATRRRVHLVLTERQGEMA